MSMACAVKAKTVGDHAASSQRMESRMATELDRALDKHQVCAMIGVDPKTLYELIKTCEFPAPLQMTAGSSRWMLSEVQAFIASRPRGVRPGRRGQGK